jgi:hypothetical protein
VRALTAAAIVLLVAYLAWVAAGPVVITVPPSGVGRSPYAVPGPERGR